MMRIKQTETVLGEILVKMLLDAGSTPAISTTTRKLELRVCFFFILFTSAIIKYTQDNFLNTIAHYEELYSFSEAQYKLNIELEEMAQLAKKSWI